MESNPKLPPQGTPEGTIWFGGPVDEASVSLRFLGDDLDPDKITRLLQCEPTDAARTGEIVERFRAPSPVRRGYWKLRSARSGTDIANQISSLLDKLSDDLNAWRTLTGIYKADLFCGLFLAARNRGIELSPDLLQRIGERGLKLGFDIYGPESPKVGQP